jgi:hypothetical protein
VPQASYAELVVRDAGGGTGLSIFRIVSRLPTILELMAISPCIKT